MATLIAAAAWTVLLSVLAHGLSAIPLSAWYALYHISRPHDALLDAIARQIKIWALRTLE